MKKLAILSGILFFAINILAQQKYTSFHPGELWLDNNGVHINAHGGGLLYLDGTYYWFGEHKTEGGAGNKANVGVHCYSSIELYNWKDEGIALAVHPEGSGSDIEKGCILERPKVIYNEKTGKYVMWFHLELKNSGYGSARSGIAVADKVTGPYTFLRSVRSNPGIWPQLVASGTTKDGEKFFFMEEDEPVILEADKEIPLFIRDHEQGQMQRDMTLFVDDDGKAYHIYASEDNKTLQIAELSEDYLSHSGIYVRVFEDRYMEAPALFKKDGRYYLIMSDCTGWRPNEARSAVADHILGPWEELGNPCMGEEAELTFRSQSTYVQQIPGTDKYIYMGDRWTPDNAIDGRYIWLPIEFEGEKPVLKWQDEWRY